MLLEIQVADRSLSLAGPWERPMITTTIDLTGRQVDRYGSGTLGTQQTKPRYSREHAKLQVLMSVPPDCARRFCRLAHCHRPPTSLAYTSRAQDTRFSVPGRLEHTRHTHASLCYEKRRSSLLVSILFHSCLHSSSSLAPYLFPLPRSHPGLDSIST